MPSSKREANDLPCAFANLIAARPVGTISGAGRRPRNYNHHRRRELKRKKAFRCASSSSRGGPTQIATTNASSACPIRVRTRMGIAVSLRYGNLQLPVSRRQQAVARARIRLLRKNQPGSARPLSQHLVSSSCGIRRLQPLASKGSQPFDDVARHVSSH